MFENELILAIDSVRLAGDYLKKRIDIKITQQYEKDTKLSSDKESERLILNNLKKTGFKILSEESGLLEGQNEYCWIVDPLDGTVNYLRGIDEFACVSIALWKNNEPVLGVINRFRTDELFCGVVDVGAYLNGDAIKTSEIGKTEQAIIATGFPINRDYSSQGLFTFIKQVQLFKKVRMFGSAALMATFVATGRVDAYFEDKIMLWDVAAAMAIVRAAGGVLCYEIFDDYTCNCRIFANQGIMEDYNVKSI